MALSIEFNRIRGDTMSLQMALPQVYDAMSDTDLSASIDARREELGDDLLVLGHHYQGEAIIEHTDLTGDSLKLSRLAAVEAGARGSKYIVFCGVNFMAETADILTDDTVSVILPNLAAQCPMAAMADDEEVEYAWSAIHAALGAGWRGRVIPIAYVNSSAVVKAMVGAHGGACCTSSNAPEVFAWARAGGTTPVRRDEEIKILFLPDEHLGRNTACRCGLPADQAVWRPRLPGGGLSDEQIAGAGVILWAGHCYVHTRFRPEHVDEARAEASDRGVTVIVHPECTKEVVDKADEVGSTEYIIRRIEAAEPGTCWAVGTEVHLVHRLAQQGRPRGVGVRMLGPRLSLCAQMFRITPRHLLWVLDRLAEGCVVNRIDVPASIKRDARLAVDRMLELG